MFELIQKVPFHVTHQGVIKAHLVACFDCAEALGVGSPDQERTEEWKDSPATGSRLTSLRIYNKGSECSDWGPCPLCGQYPEPPRPDVDYTFLGAELYFYVYHVQNHEPTFEEVTKDLLRIEDQLREEDDPDYREWLLARVKELENLQESMLL